MHNFDPVVIRNALIKKYNPQKYPEPYNKDEFELVSPIGEENRKGLIKVFMDLPNEYAVALYKTSDSLAEIRKEASTYGALEKVYQGPFEDIISESDKYRFARLLIDNINNSMGPRNRKRIVKRELVNFVKATRVRSSDQITILSIGAGSARAILEASASLEEHGAGLRLLLLDIDHKALLDAKRLAKEKGVNAQLETIRANFVQFIQNNNMHEQIDFIEIVGLLDYLNDKHINFLLSQVRKYVRKDGTVLFSNIAPNDEEKFLHTVVGWPQMIYRTKEQLLRLVYEGGFREVELIQEPIGIYNFVKARK